MIKRCYAELQLLNTFDERFEYLKLPGMVGRRIFGIDRYLNQVFYKSQEWKQVRSKVIWRDRGCDLGIPGYEISVDILIHHMNPITLDDLESFNPEILDPEFLITTTGTTHQAIHYSNEARTLKVPKQRRPGDTKLW